MEDIWLLKRDRVNIEISVDASETGLEPGLLGLQNGETQGEATRILRAGSHRAWKRSWASCLKQEEALGHLGKESEEGEPSPLIRTLEKWLRLFRGENWT